MQNKTFKILVLVALVLGVIFAWIIISDARSKKAAEAPVDTGIEDPFGAGVEDQDLEGEDEGETPIPSGDGSTEPLPIQEPVDNIVIIEDDPILARLSDDSVAGFTFVKEDRIIETPDSTTPDAGIVEVYDFSGYKTIRFGDKADEIVKIKTVLNRQNPSPALVINTDYDTDMKNAVIDFQNRSGLTGDGVIGPKTYTKMNEFQGITTFSATKKPDNIEVVDMIRYVESSGGIMYDKAIRKPEAKRAITKTAIPRVNEAFFNDTGNKAILRYLKDETIETYLVNLNFPKIDPNLTKEERDAISRMAVIDGEFLPQNIKSIGVSKDKKNFFYMNPVSGGVAGIVYNFAAKTKKQIFDSPFTEWIVDYGSDLKVNLTTKASGFVAGYSYGTDVKSSALSKHIGGKNGLTTLMSPDGKKLLYAEYANESLSTFILDVVTGKMNAISPSALPEKCVWTRDSKSLYCASSVKAAKMVYPDDWYKGKTTFDDSLWMIDAEDFTGNIIYDIPSKSNQKLDATNLSLNTEENYLGFINKKDGTLWGYDLSR